MPEFGDFVFWGFQTAFLGLVALVLKEIKGMRQDIRKGQRVNNWLRHAVLQWHTRCAFLHPEHAMPPLGTDPDNED